MRELVFVHGRAQQRKDSVALKAEWISALRDGLAKSGLELPIPESQVRFPYYGDTLFDLASGSTGDQAAEVVIRGGAAEAEQREFMQSILEEVQEKAGVSDRDVAVAAGGAIARGGPLDWAWVQRTLEVIDRRVPFASGASIALFTNDVYQYLKNPGVLLKIETGVRAAVTKDVETVVVAHSLGSVVAYNLLRREGVPNGWNVPLLLTVGCPLGVKAIRKALAPIGHPECVQRWVNAFDTRDVVALHPLDGKHFGIDPAVENLEHVRNHTDNRHGSAGYLDDSKVAALIHQALVA